MPDAEVARWLKSAGLSRFIPRFDAANISSTDFLELLPGDFDAFGIDSPADRKRLNDLVTERRRAASLPRRTSPSRPRIKTEATLAREGELRERRKEKERARLEKLAGGPKGKQVARVSVCVRKRPLSGKETAKLDQDIIEASGHNSLNVFELKEKVDLTKYVETHNFVFDRVFSDSCDNEEVYEDTAKPLVEALFEGGRSTCFAYGQTGAGKTYTMAGDGYETPGLYSLAVQDLFETIEYRREQAEMRRAERSESEDDDFDADEYLEVWISFFEIYGTRLHDLLGNRAKLECREDTNNEVQIVGLTERKCENEEDVFIAIDEANQLRSTGVTGANDDSSRSHAVFQIELRQAIPDGRLSESSLMRNSILTGRGRSELEETSRKPKEIGRLCFIDLAGSERGSDTANNDKQTRMEGAEINKSLLALKECIRAMGQQKNHTPFRGSKLTQVLKASFIGKNCRTVMIANVSPASSNVEHTLNTLRYSDRVKEIRKDRVGLNPNATFSSSRSLGRANRPVRRATFAAGINSAKDSQNEGHLASAMRNRKVAASSSDDLDNSRRQSEKIVRPKLPRGQPIQRSTRRVTRAATRSGRVSPPSSGELPPTAPLAANNSSDNVSLSALREQRGNTRLRGTQSSASLPKRRTMIPPAPKSKKGSDSDGNSGSGSGSGSENGPTRRSRITRRQTSATLSRPNTRLRVREAAAKIEAEQAAAAAAAVEVIEVEEEEVISRVRPARPISSSGSGSARVVPKETKARPKSGGWLPDAVDYFSGADEEAEDSEILFKKAPAPKPSTVRDVQAVAGLSPLRTRSGTVRNTRTDNVQASTTSTITEESVSETSASTQRLDVHNTSMKEVIRHHHMQIEELMRLCEMDVQLVKAAENGQIDASDYAIRLDKNLTQKLDAVINLKAMVGWLTSSK